MSDRPAPSVRTTDFSLQKSAENPLARNFLQWNVVTPDIDQSCQAIQRAFGVAGFVIIENAPINNVRYLGEAIDLRIDLALGYLGDINVEVISPRPEGDANVYSNFLKERSSGGLHHFAYRIYDLDAAKKLMEPTFGEAVMTGDFGDDGTAFAYFDTRPACGVFTELIYLGPSTEIFMDSIRNGNPITSLG